MNVSMAALAVFCIALIMSMTGRGGGNFYVPVLIAFGLGAHFAAATSQLILMAASLAAMIVFHKSKAVDWKLALVLDPPTDIMAFVGGYYAHLFPESVMKSIFAVLLVAAALFMLFPVSEKAREIRPGAGFWRREFGEDSYVVNLWLAVPITALTGLVAGMVGISGGSFKVPLMVLACGVPMRVAVGTSSAMVAVTAFMGFLGHSFGGGIDLAGAIPLMLAAVAGGLSGGKLAGKTRQGNLKRLFALTTLAAAVFMILNIWMTTR